MEALQSILYFQVISRAFLLVQQTPSGCQNVPKNWCSVYVCYHNLISKWQRKGVLRRDVNKILCWARIRHLCSLSAFLSLLCSSIVTYFDAYTLFYGLCTPFLALFSKTTYYDLLFKTTPSTNNYVFLWWNCIPQGLFILAFPKLPPLTSTRNPDFL